MRSDTAAKVKLPLEGLAIAAGAGSSTAMALRISPRLKWQAAMVALVTGLVLFSTGRGPMEVANDLLQDELQNFTRSTVAETEFVLLMIDQQTLGVTEILDEEEIAGSRALQLIQQGYPWSREVYALAAKRLLDAGARVVVFDLLFPSPREGDDAFAAVIRDHPGRIVLASNFEKSASAQTTGVNQQYSPPTPQLASAADHAVGFATLPSQGNGTIRTVWPYATSTTIAGHPPLPGENPIPALATATALQLGKEIPVSFKPLRFRYGRSNFFRSVPLYEIFVPALWKANHADGARFRDRVVMVGPTAQHFQDYHMTPLGRLAGPIIHLNILSALLNGDWLREAGPILTTLCTLFAGAAVFGLIMLRRSPRAFVLGLILGAVGWLVVCAGGLLLAAFLFPVAPPLLTWLLGGFASLAVDVSMERTERSRMRTMFERYVSKDVVEEMVKDEQAFHETLGRKEMVALFADLQGFTADSERLEPEELLSQLNNYFREMVRTVFSHGGTLDKFMGDAIMATWGGIKPKGPEEDACRAVGAALEMKDRLAEINARRVEASLAPWKSGIGLSQGMAIYGHVGSEQNMGLTAVGDSVNLASRIEGLTRVYGCGILVDERIARRASRVCSFLPVDTVRVKGKRKPEELFLPYRTPDPAWVADYLDARENYRAGDFAGARAIFARLAQGGLAPALAQRFLTRCEFLLEKPPGPGWTGVWDFFEK